MAIRTEMTDMIAYLRQYGAAATDDEFQGVTYWTDAQLQDILDKHAHHDTVLLAIYTPTSWALRCPRHVWLSSDATIVDALGSPYSGDFEYNSSFGEIIFTTAPTSTQILYATGLQVNLFEALADLWQQKAAQRYDYVNFKAGNNKMDMNSELQNCERQRDYYRSRTIRRYPRVTSRFK